MHIIIFYEDDVPYYIGLGNVWCSFGDGLGVLDDVSIKFHTEGEAFTHAMDHNIIMPGAISVTIEEAHVIEMMAG